MVTTTWCLLPSGTPEELGRGLPDDDCLGSAYADAQVRREGWSAGGRPSALEPWMPDPSPAWKPAALHWLRGVGSRLPDPLRRDRRAGPNPDHVVVRLSGEITARNGERIGIRLQDAPRSHPAVLEIDVGDVKYLNSDGAAAFFMALHAARTYGTHVAVTHVRPDARRVLQQLGLGRVLEMHEGGRSLGRP